MADLGAQGSGSIRVLDALASDSRSLLRRAARLQRQALGLEDPEAEGMATELVESAERLLGRLEELRAAARRLARRQLREG